MIRLRDEEIEIEREAYAIESRKIWARNRTREWKLKKPSELDSCFARVAQAQLKKALLGVGKEVKRMDNTAYLVPDYHKYREALKEAGLDG
ncbi:hypothetical protein LCGC14_0406410 [marine sediment metagenome]|uniref:Uncharacterized protein n=1 Tax=marine sediment metagenome TaxID=412755 RepID=A0A0F9TDH4_9ZZZZ